jgi:hypothetical protein
VLRLRAELGRVEVQNEAGLDRGENTHARLHASETDGNYARVMLLKSKE